MSSVSSKPKLFTLGGDHSLTLPALRALKEIYGKPVRVLHFDGEFYGLGRSSLLADVYSALGYVGSCQVSCSLGLDAFHTRIYVLDGKH